MKQVIETLRRQLAGLYDEREVKSIIYWLAEEVCGLSRTQILLYADSLHPTDGQRSRLMSIGKRMSEGVPMQYAVGYEYFCGRRFAVNPSVLIPRPETAEVINWIVDNEVDNVSISGDEAVDKLSAPGHNPVEKSGRKILDIGTGSGCIALSLASEVNNCHVVAADLSTDALEVAAHNAKSLELNNVSFLNIDILQWKTIQLSTGCQPDVNNFSTAYPHSFQELSESYQPPFDIIVSNPPYVCMNEKAEMAAHVVNHEPHLALFVPDEDPLLFYRAIADFGCSYLAPGGWLYFEINASYGAGVCQLLRDRGYKCVELKQDFTGRDRFVRAKL